MVLHNHAPGYRIGLMLILMAAPIVFPDGLDAQIPDSRGMVYHQSYSGHDYQGAPQNWDMLQDDDGLLYIANSGGVLLFDGVSWEMIHLDGTRPARSLARGDDGRIYVSGLNEIGYLEPDSIGSPVYRSLVDSLPENLIPGNVWDVVRADDGIYFRDDQYMILWDYEKATLWSAGEDARFGRMFSYRENPVVNHSKFGLLTVENGRLSIVSDYPVLDHEGVIVFVELPDETVFAGFQQNGFFRLHEQVMDVPESPESDDPDDHHGTDSVCHMDSDNVPFASWGFQFESIETGLDENLENIPLYGGILLDSGDIAINTINTGIFVLDSDGNLRDQLTENEGLRTNLVLNLNQDHEGGLWAMANNGLTRFEYGRPLRYWDNNLGLSNSVLSLTRAHDTLFIGTSQGLFYLDAYDSPETRSSDPVEVISRHQLRKVMAADEGQTWGMMPMSDVLGADAEGLLIAGPEEHLYVMRDGKKVTIPGTDGHSILFSFHSSRFHDHTFFVGGINLILSVTVDPDAYERGAYEDAFDVTTIPLERTDIRFMTEDQHGYLWLANRFEDILRLDTRESAHDPEVSVYRFRMDDYPFITEREHFVGLLPGEEWGLATGNGLYLLTEAYERYHDADSIPPYVFEKDPRIHEQVPGEQASVYRFLTAADGSDDIWVYRPGGVSLLEKQDETGQWFLDDEILPDDIFVGIYAMYADEEGEIWLGGDESMVMLDRSLSDRYHVPFRSVIRGAYDREDQPLLSRSALSERRLPDDETEQGSRIVLPYEQNNIRLTYSASTFSDPGATEFQVMMEGFEDAWSGWNSLAFREYTNLPEGEYIFRVRARNGHGVIGEEDQIYLTILPPWYRTTLAYILYIAGILGAVFLLLKWRTRLLQKRNRELEEQVIARTQELREESRKLEAANQTMSRFMRIVAHDLRNPVGVVMGYCDLLQADKKDPDMVEEYSSFINSAGRRMLRLLEDLMNFNHINNDDLEVHYEKVDLSRLCRSIVRDFQMLSRAKSQNLAGQIPDGCHFVCDKSKMRSIIENLIGNAVKYTGRGGNISLEVWEDDDEMVLEVSDTGLGFTEKDKEKLFGEFQTLSSRPTGGEGATGLGLYIVRNLVDAHGGSIALESEKDSGSTFTVRIPKVQDEVANVS